MDTLDGELDLMDFELSEDSMFAESAFEADSFDFDFETGFEDLEYEDSFDAFDLDYENDVDFEYETDFEVIGKDTRKRIGNTRKVPFRYICHLSNGCTGTLVAPNKVLTVAHCAYDRGSKRETWRGHTATPGRNGPGTSRRAVPYGSARIIRADFPRAYRTASSWNAAWPHDYAVLTLNERLKVPGGAFSRLRVVSASKLVRIKVNTAGYPGHGGQRQYWTYNRITSVSGARMRHVLDTKPGQSGSPIWLRYKDTRSIIGIHKAGIDSKNENHGVALTSSNLAQIRAWIKR